MMEKRLANNLRWPRDEDEHVVAMNAWKVNKERELIAHRIALRQMTKDRANPSAYSVTLTRLLRNVQYPAEFD